MSQSPPDGFRDEFSSSQLDAVIQQAKDAADALELQVKAAVLGRMVVYLHGAGGSGGAGGGGGGVVSGAGYSRGGGAGGGGWSAPVQFSAGGGGGSRAAYQARPQRGASGFDGVGVAIGTVRGYRWWSMSAPDLTLSPSDAGSWVPDWLRGARDIAWHPGENTAVCLNHGAHDPDETPLLECGCGFWSYWHRKPPQVTGPVLVQGVIEGYGNVLTGPLGSRCSRARILALCLGFQATAVMQAASYTSLLRKHLPNSKVYDYGGGGTYVLAGDGTPEHIAARDAAEAWTAVISDRLALMYPEARVYETERLMYAEWPPDPAYAGECLQPQ